MTPAPIMRRMSAAAPRAGRPRLTPPGAPSPMPNAATTVISAPSLLPPPRWSHRMHPAVTVLAHTDQVVAHTLLNCLLREVSGPERQTVVTDGQLRIRLPRCGVLLRVGLRRTSLIGAHRFSGPVSEERDGRWSEVSWHALAGYVHRELELRTGVRNDEFLDQVTASHATVGTALGAGPHPVDDDPAVPREDAYLESEQSLLFGHRFHPTPKARTGSPESWRRYAPEAGARFPLHHLAVRREFVREESAFPGAVSVLDRLHPVPDGYRLVPAHPWQYAMLREHQVLRAALRREDVLDLGPGGRQVAPTASVRTVYDGRDFLKFSLNVRITNCLRKNAEYELSGAVALTRLLEPIAVELAARFPGSELLREPAYRTLDLGDRELTEGFGVIVREGLAARLRPGLTGLLAAAVADEYPTGPAQLSRLLGAAGPDQALRWWRSVSVAAGTTGAGRLLRPRRGAGAASAKRRDRRGRRRDTRTRCSSATWKAPSCCPSGTPDALAALPHRGGRARSRTTRARLGPGGLLPAGQPPRRDAGRVSADLHPPLEPVLWSAVRQVLRECGAAHGDPPALRALLAGGPLPAKANLLTRWGRKADRDAGYVRITSPLASDLLTEAASSAEAAGG